MAKPEKTRKIIWRISLIILGISLVCPTYCTNVQCSGPLSGLTDLLFGWFGALFMGNTYAAWFANPFFIAAIFTNKKDPLFSLIFSVVALFIAFTFLDGGTVLLNEAGHKGYITKLEAGYWLWVSSMVIMIFAALVPIVHRVNAYLTKKHYQAHDEK